MTESDRDLVSRVRTSIDGIDVPHRSLDAAKARGKARRRTARLGVVGVSVVLAVALIGPLLLLSGLGRQQHVEGPTPTARPAPPADCPNPIPSPQPGYHISCEDAVKQAWEAAAYLQSASGATARQVDTNVAENYLVPAWAVTFVDAKYVAGVGGCQESGTLYTLAEWGVSDVSGRLLWSPTRPHGCIVNENPTPIPLAYSGTTYTDPSGWQIDVPYGWLTAPVDVTTSDGIEVHGMQIMNPISLDVPKNSVAKDPGSPAHTILVGTFEIGVVIATDTDPNLSHEPLLMPPINLSEFSHGVQQGGPGQGETLDVAWVQHADGRDISITAGIGGYAIPDDVMLLRDMLATFRYGEVSSTSAIRACGSSDLQLFLDGQQVATMSAADIYALRNVSGSPCSLKGYPEVSATDSAGQPVELHVSRAIESAPPQDVTLQPGDAVSFDLTFVNDPSTPNSTPCTTPVASIDITPPGDAAPLSTTDSFLHICAGDNLFVSSVHAGVPVPTGSASP